MDSINKNQPEDNFENLSGEQAVEKIKDLVEQANSCFFCTKLGSTGSFSTRPMAVQQVDDYGNLWFLSAKDSKKNQEIKEDEKVQLLFQGSAYSDFLSVYGDAEVSDDEDLIQQLWEPSLKTWFTEGEQDPRITVIKVTPQNGYYWDTKHAKPVGFIKRMVGAAIGKTLDDSIEGEIKL